VTYQNDPNSNPRNLNPRGGPASYTGWIIGGALALAVIVGIFVVLGRTSPTGTAGNATRPAATAVPAPTSGTGTAGTARVAPDSGQATAGSPTTGSR
jgi:hypothetical protein